MIVPLLDLGHALIHGEDWDKVPLVRYGRLAKAIPDLDLKRLA